MRLITFRFMLLCTRRGLSKAVSLFFDATRAVESLHSHEAFMHIRQAGSVRNRSARRGDTPRFCIHLAFCFDTIPVDASLAMFALHG